MDITMMHNTQHDTLNICNGKANISADAQVEVARHRRGGSGIYHRTNNITSYIGDERPRWRRPDIGAEVEAQMIRNITKNGLEGNLIVPKEMHLFLDKIRKDTHNCSLY